MCLSAGVCAIDQAKVFRGLSRGGHVSDVIYDKILFQKKASISRDTDIVESRGISRVLIL